MKNITVTSEATGVLGQLALVSRILAQLKVRLLIFFPTEDGLFIFSIFKVRIFYLKKVPAPLTESYGSPVISEMLDLTKDRWWGFMRVHIAIVSGFYICVYYSVEVENDTPYAYKRGDYFDTSRTCSSLAFNIYERLHLELE